MVRLNNDGTALDILNTIELTDTKLLEIKEWLISTLTEQYESFIGYDCTSDTPIHFEVQFANSSNSSFDTVCRYRVLE